MKRFAAFAAIGASLCLGTLAGAQEIETFDSPNQTQNGNGNFAFANPLGGSWTAAGAIVDNPTSVTINTPSYGTAYHNLFSQDTPNVVNVSGSSTLQLDVTINSGDAGPFVDLQDGEGDFWQYRFGFGLVGSGNAPPQFPGETITELGNNELRLDIPLATPFDNGGSPTFDFSQIVLFRLEDDPGASSTNSISFNDLSAVNVPEPTSLGIGALACVFFARRRRQAV
jgi:hypothetical protein